MNKKLLISIIITIVYAFITLICVLHHEIWADEAQVWQLSKYLSFSDLIKHLHNEGHPSFFYLLIMPFAKLTSDIVYMQLMCWLFMCFAVFLLVNFAPFKYFTKLAILSSAGFLYFFPVIARSYSLLPFLVFLSAILYSKSKQHPVIYSIVLFLTANTHIIMFGFVFILFCFFIHDNIYKNIKNNLSIKQFILPVIIIFTGLLACTIQLYDTTSNNEFIHFDFKNLISNTIKVSSFFFINAYNKTISLKNALSNPLIDIPIIFLMVITYILCFYKLYLQNKKLFYLAFSSIAFQFIVYIIAYSAHIYVTRIFCAHIILIFCFWILFCNNNINIKSSRLINILISILFFLTSYNGINYYLMELKYNYAGAKETALFIKNNINKNALLFIDNEPYMISLIYYLDNKYNLYSPLRKKNIKYIIWDTYASKVFADAAWCNFIDYYTEKNNIDKNNIYVILSTDEEKMKGSSLPADSFELIFSSSYIIENREGFKVYKYSLI